MPLAEIMTAYKSAKAAYEIAKGINSLNTEVERNQAVTDVLQVLLTVQENALAMQEKYQSLLDEKEKIAKQLMEKENWEKTESQYDLVRTSIGSFVRSPNSAHPHPKPFHWLCANCFEKHEKSILQKVNSGEDAPFYCPSCKTRIALGLKEQPLFRG